MLEQRFERVRIRGEVSRTTRARSGHVYFGLKDEKATLDAVAWKAIAARFQFDVVEGLEVIATGKISAYPGQSKYQLIIDSLELAGEGALLKLLEDRRRALQAEGLFDPARKQALPLLPRSIGVVSSPNGAVIRDIWHRVRERFPLPVQLWPVLVQGRDAAAQVAAAIDGFAALPAQTRPDVLIIARGGGSLEDLWAFNEEAVVRAAARCPIPLISAIGHETDTTLLDFVADRRAPTPTAAAEFAVPLRADLMHEVTQAESRLGRATDTQLRTAQQGLIDVSRAMADPQALVMRAAQDLDVTLDQLGRAVTHILREANLRLAQATARLSDPWTALRAKAEPLIALDPAQRLTTALRRLLKARGQDLEATWGPLAARQEARETLRAQGWVTVQDASGHMLTSAAQISAAAAYDLTFHDGKAQVIGAGQPDPKPTPKPIPKPRPKRPKDPQRPAKQASLF